MNIGNTRVVLLVALAVALSACGSRDKEAEKTTSAPVADADNTARNERDNSAAAITPLDQGENANDLAITSKIRQAIVDDKSLSSNAHNIKIVTSAGVVTLRGPVKSATEKTKIAELAQQAAPSAKINNQLEVKASE